MTLHTSTMYLVAPVEHMDVDVALAEVARRLHTVGDFIDFVAD